MRDPARRVARRYLARRVVAEVDSLGRLYRYLSKPDWERAFEAVKIREEDGYLDPLFDWAREHYGDTAPDPVVQSVLDDPDKMYEVYFEDISPEVYQAYYQSYEWAPPEWYQPLGKAPSWFNLTRPKLVKNQWLIHFTNDAEAIAKQGFKHGVRDLTRLGNATSNALHAKRSSGKFNFAYLVSDPGYRKGVKYGHEAVVFKANGVAAWHEGDQETQVVFEGSTARDIKPITQEYGAWYVGGQPEGGFDTLAEAVSWATR